MSHADRLFVMTYYASAGYAQRRLLRFHNVPLSRSVPLSRANMDSSAGRASPLHTCCGGDIIRPRAIFSSVVCLYDVCFDPIGLFIFISLVNILTHLPPP